MSVGQNTGRSPQASAGPQSDPAPDWNAVREDVSQLAEVAVERGRGFVDSARQQAIQLVEQRKSAAARSVTELANALRESGRSFDDRANIRGLFDTAAEGLEQFARGVEDRSLEDMYGDVEAMLRRRPAAAAAATFALGFLLSRFVKASADSVRREARLQQPRRRVPARSSPQLRA